MKAPNGSETQTGGKPGRSPGTHGQGGEPGCGARAGEAQTAERTHTDSWLATAEHKANTPAGNFHTLCSFLLLSQGSISKIPGSFVLLSTGLQPVHCECQGGMLLSTLPQLLLESRSCRGGCYTHCSRHHRWGAAALTHLARSSRSRF